MSAQLSLSPVVYRFSSKTLLVAAATALGMLAAFAPALSHMVRTWQEREEYSHGFLIPVISLFLIWQQKDRLEQTPFTVSWWGVALAAAGGLIYLMGFFATIYSAMQYGFLICLYGLVLASVGWNAFRRIAVPLAMLALMIPLPSFVLSAFSNQLQLLSSQLGVLLVRLFGISVYLEGNVIDLGAYQLQVAEACDGLRYLFPLLTIGFIMAYFFRAALWKRVVLFLSSIPITIGMNSLRIGIIGVTVEYWGVSMAEGLLHEFQGWVVFMSSFLLMVGEMTLLARWGGAKTRWREAFGLEFPAPAPRDAERRSRPLPTSAFGALAVVAAIATVCLAIPQHAPTVPARETFVGFPRSLGPWHGTMEALQRVYLDVLNLDDYLNINYVRGERDPVNLYMAWYDSQLEGRYMHSPRSCIPGGGWQIEDLRSLPIEGVRLGAQDLRVNRAVIQLGAQKQIVYYWFQQRGRVVTNEYLVKWYLFWDALTRNRTDGALVRVASPLLSGEAESAVDERLKQFTALAVHDLARYVPD